MSLSRLFPGPSATEKLAQEITPLQVRINWIIIACAKGPRVRQISSANSLAANLKQESI